MLRAYDFEYALRLRSGFELSLYTERTGLSVSRIQAALETAQAIGANGPLATRGSKTIARARQEPGFRAARELSNTLRYALEWSHDVDEGLSAAQAGRTAKFTGK